MNADPGSKGPSNGSGNPGARPRLPDVRREQRFTAARPCPVCGGHDQLPRGQGRRCYGYRSPDGRFVFCTREELAGPLSLNTKSNAFRHGLKVPCRCGAWHEEVSLEVLPRPGRPPAPRAATRRGRRRVVVYSYVDAVNDLVYQVLRRPGKRFVVRRPDGQGGWVTNAKGVARVLYRLPELLAADPEAPVFVVEGEKDVDRLRRDGLIATTNPFGAGKWRDAYMGYLAGRRVVILRDNDAPGLRHAQRVARALLPVAAWVKWVELPGVGPGEDVSDWLAAGNTAADLRQLVASAPIVTREDLAARAAEAAAAADRASPWDKAVAAPDFVRRTPPAVPWLVPGVLARGAITTWAAPRGLGKSLIALKLATELARGGTFCGQPLTPVRVLYVDRDNPDFVVGSRLVAWGGADVPDLKVLTRDDAPDLTQKGAWAQFPVERFDVVIIDSVGSSTEGVTEKEGKETSMILATLRDLAAKGVAILLLTNTTKGAEYFKGRAEWADRIDILYELRDATGLQPSGQKPWWQELPGGGEAAWGERAARRQRRTTFRMAFVPSKFRLGPEPAPFCLEAAVPDDRPWALRDVTAQLAAEGEQAAFQVQFDALARKTGAVFELTRAIRERQGQGAPMGKTEAVNLLCAGGFTRQEARAFVEQADGTRWRLERTRRGTGKQGAYVVLPLADPDTRAS